MGAASSSARGGGTDGPFDLPRTTSVLHRIRTGVMPKRISDIRPVLGYPNAWQAVEKQTIYKNAAEQSEQASQNIAAVSSERIDARAWKHQLQNSSALAFSFSFSLPFSCWRMLNFAGERHVECNPLLKPCVFAGDATTCLCRDACFFLSSSPQTSSLGLPSRAQSRMPDDRPRRPTSRPTPRHRAGPQTRHQPPTRPPVPFLTCSSSPSCHPRRLPPSPPSSDKSPP